MANATTQRYQTIAGQGRAAKRNLVINEGVDGKQGTISYDKRLGYGGGGTVTEPLLSGEQAEAQRVANLTGRALKAYQAQKAKGGAPQFRKGTPLPEGYVSPQNKSQFDTVRINTPSVTSGVDAGDPTFVPGRTQSLTERIQGGPTTAIATKSDEVRKGNIAARKIQILQGERSGMAARLANYRGPRDMAEDVTQVASLTGRQKKKLSAAATY